MDIWQRLIELEINAEDFGLTWPDALTILQQIESECREIREQLAEEKHDDALLSAEIGDLMHAVMSLSWFCGFDSHQVLTQSCDKFSNRLQMMKTIAKEQGLTHLQDKSFSEVMFNWKLAKERLQKN